MQLESTLKIWESLSALTRAFYEGRKQLSAIPTEHLNAPSDRERENRSHPFLTASLPSPPREGRAPPALLLPPQPGAPAPAPPEDRKGRLRRRSPSPA